MLYNGVELPNIDSVWTNKETYPYMAITRTSRPHYAFSTSRPFYAIMDGSTVKLYTSPDGTTVAIRYDLERDADDWTVNTSYTYQPNTLLADIPIWANYNILFPDGSVCVDSSVVIDPNAPVESPVMDILSITADSSSIHTNFNVSGISVDSLYTIAASCFSGEQVVGSSAVGPYSGPEFQATVSVDGLSPSTEYRVEYQLSRDGEYTGVSQTVTATTAAASGSGSGDGSDDSGSCACPSILNSILSAITVQTNFLSTWQQTWTTRMDSFESTLSKLIPVPDPTETALKESVKDTTDSFTKQFWSEDGDGFGRTSFSTSTEALTSSKDMLDTGVSVTDFFGMFGTYGWGNWFSAETRDDLDSVPSVSTFAANDELSTYEKNLREIQNFIGGG